MSRITLGTNISSLFVQRQLANASSAASSSYERLSSGMRINRASDDPAGLSVADQLSVQARIAKQGIRNINDAISAVSIAEGALKELSTITQRQIELAQQAANGAYSISQRKALQNEMTALANEFNRIIGSTEYNGKNLFGLTSDSISVQAGVGAENSIAIQLASELNRTVADGTFASSSNFVLSAASVNPIVADFTGDGIADIVTFEDAGAMSQSGIRIGRGDGTFSALQIFNSGEYSLGGGMAGDFDNDGDLDLAAAEGFMTKVYLNDGNGNFSEALSVPTGADPSKAAVGDFNGDGNLDILTTDLTAATGSIFFGNGDGTFRAKGTAIFPSSQSPDQRHIGDVNGDGKDDLVYSDKLYISNGDGTFAVSNLPVGAGSAVLGDVNGDGNLDIAAVGTGAIYLGNGDGTFKAGIDIGIVATNIALIDLNEDGRADIVGAHDATYIGEVYLSQDDGTFALTSTFTSIALPFNFFAVDANGDGASDLFSVAPYQDVTVFYSNSTGSPFAPLLNILTQSKAKTALTELNSQLTRVTAEIGAMGAFRSRLEVAVSNLAASHLEFEAAASRIRDADIAGEAADVIRQQLLQRAAASVLAQANQLPLLALELLRD
ncbi:MAG: VCBS repeat-containing protein [Deltaproteobacteria bacterium]|nr:VCBS repeat-containing protein [Deltaproteobacteria bacterium]